MRVHPAVTAVLFLVVVIILIAAIGITVLRFVLEFPVWTCIIFGLVLLFVFIASRD